MPSGKKPEQTSRILILGKAGSGKTTLARMESWASRVVILNPMRLKFQCANLSESRSIKREMRRPGFRFSVAPHEAEPEKFGALLEQVTADAYRIGDVLIVVDEIDQYYKDSPGLQRAVRYGRNRGISILATCRRPAEISRDVTANLTGLRLFRTDEPRDLDYLKHFSMGSLAARAAELDRFEYLAFDFYSHRWWYGRT